MASKCWFVLSQTHYPPPTLPKHGFGLSSGPLCLGHLIPDLRHLDNVINRKGPLELPPSMPIQSTKAWAIQWRLENTSEMGLSTAAGVPIAAAAGLTLKLDAGIAFQTTVSRFWEFESLDSYIIQPTNAYVEESLDSEEVSTYFERRGLLRSSTLFMITGIIVARGAAVSTTEAHSRDVSGGPGVEIPMIAEVGGKVESSQGNSLSSSAQRTSDFVWAIRLARISKGFLDRKWTFETMSRGATFGLNEKVELGREIIESLRGEGLNLEGYNLGAEDNIFVLGSDLE